METYALSQAWSVIGHDWAVDLLRGAIAADNLSHALLITGAPSVGKGTVALSLAQELLCTADERPCGLCRACRLVASGSHPDLQWIEPSGGSIKINQIRELTRQLILAPLEGPWQIAVLDRFELATPSATDALLKTLEEPPPNVVILLLAQQAETLPPTIVSRCQLIALRPVPRISIERALRQNWNVPQEQARLLSHISGGRLGWAVSALNSPKLLEHRTQRLQDLAKLLHSPRVQRFAYAEKLARQPSETILEILESWTGWWRDLLLLLTNSTVPLTNIDQQSELVQVAGQSDILTVRVTLAALRRTVHQLSLNVNIRLALEVLLLDFPVLQ